MKTALAVVGSILGLFALVALIWGFSFGFGWLTAAPNGKLEARKSIQSGSSRIAAYDHFFNLCASIQTDDSRIDAQLDELAASTGDDAARVRSNISGLTADRADAINEYNADASKDYTIGQFRSSALPYHIDTAPHRKGVTISCAT